MRIATNTALAFATMFAFGAQAADLGTKPHFIISGDPALTAFGPSWVSAAIPTGTGFSAAAIQMSYFFEVAGPGGFVPVPVIVDYELKGASSGQAVALSTIKVVTTGTGGPSRTVTTTPGMRSYAVDDSLAFTINTNAAYQVILQVNVSTSLLGDEASAYTDPYIHVESGWLSTHPGYVVNVTPGIINQVASAVPEPSMLTLMASGFVALAGLGRRRLRAAEGSPRA